MAINSTAIYATIKSPPYIPPRDNWTYVDKCDMLYFETNNATPRVEKFEFTGSMPRTMHVTNLKKYTDYTFYAHYYGYLHGTIEHHIITNSIVRKTDEDGKYFRIFHIIPSEQTQLIHSAGSCIKNCRRFMALNC